MKILINIDLLIIPQNPDGNDILLHSHLITEGIVDALLIQLNIEALKPLHPVVLADPEPQQMQTLLGSHETGLQVESRLGQEFTDRVVVEIRQVLFESYLEGGVVR